MRLQVEKGNFHFVVWVNLGGRKLQLKLHALCLQPTLRSCATHPANASISRIFSSLTEGSVRVALIE